MKEAAARAKLRRAVLEPLNRPVVAHYKGKDYKLTPGQAKVGVDIDGSISQAIQRSREGNIFARTARNLQGKQINEDIKLDIAYNHRAITRLVRRISKQIDRAPRDATLNLEQGDVNPTPSATGLTVRAAKLRSQLQNSLAIVAGILPSGCSVDVRWNQSTHVSRISFGQSGLMRASTDIAIRSRNNQRHGKPVSNSGIRDQSPLDLYPVHGALRYRGESASSQDASTTEGISVNDIGTCGSKTIGRGLKRREYG